MSDAREWLTEDMLGTVTVDFWARYAAMKRALLAVLDECDKFDGESDELAPKGDWGESMGDTVWADALVHASDRIHAAIDAALGVTDE